MDRLLSTEEAAQRLGVKPATLYAYVSRGLLASHPAPGGRRSLFVAADVERLARRGKRERQRGLGTAPVMTAVTELTAQGPRYRGVDLRTLLEDRQTSFEDVAAWLWDPAPRRSYDVPPATGFHWAPRPVGRPPDFAPDDTLRWCVVACGALDPRRGDLARPGVTAAARSLTATMATEVPGPGPAVDERSSLAERLTTRLSRRRPSGASVAAVDAVLMALADHELASSTMAVRLAASTRASVYDAVLAGLGVLGGRLHGGVAPLAHALLGEVRRRGAARALDEALHWHGAVPGLGHSLDLYAGGDPRFSLLMPFFERLASAPQARALHALVQLVRDQGLPPPNVDLAVAGIVQAAGMGPEAGRVLFTVARSAGWVAHFLEELEERPLRFRIRAVHAEPATL